MGTVTPTTTMTTGDVALAAPRTAASLLQILWLASPALPVGGFSYSEGLESAVDAGLVHDETSAAAWLTDQLHLSLARITALNHWGLQTRETLEFRLQSEQMGRSLLEWARQLGELGTGVFEQLHNARLDPPTYPVACACAASSTGSSVHDSLVGDAFGWCENMVQASIKSVPLGQSAGQRMLARLAQRIPAAVDHAIALHDDDRRAFTPLLAIHSARHETQYSRLFRS